MTAKTHLKRVSYCQWAVEGPRRDVIIRRNGRRFQVFERGKPMLDGFFHETFSRFYQAEAYARTLAGLPVVSVIHHEEQSLSVRAFLASRAS